MSHKQKTVFVSTDFMLNQINNWGKMKPELIHFRKLSIHIMWSDFINFSMIRAQTHEFINIIFYSTLRPRPTCVPICKETLLSENRYSRCPIHQSTTGP